MSDVATAEDVYRIKFLGVMAGVFRDRSTRFVDLEGALNCGKTTLCLWKEWTAAAEWYPGIYIFIGRFADGDNQTKLLPAWNDVLELGGVKAQWNSKYLYYQFPNGSRVYSYGLQSPDPRRRYAKLRGLGVSRIYIDQAEELPPDFFPELQQRLRQHGYPHQLTLSPNPLDENSWLAREFPVDNRRPNRVYHSISLFDNAHNLPEGKVDDALDAYPVTHAKHRSAVLGLRGLNVVGEPVYGGAFVRAQHVRPLTFNPALPIEEAIDFGKHHPCYLARQRNPYGGVEYLGGIMGQSMYLEDFLPVVKMYRALWFPQAEFRTCCDPAGSHSNSQGVRSNGVGVLKDHEFAPKWVDDANRTSVRFTMIERQAKLMRTRTPMGESYGVNSDPSHWLRVTGGGQPPATWHFLADGDEAGYVWDEHMVSEGSKQYRRAHKDGWYEHAQNCKEYLEVTFSLEKQKKKPEPAPSLPVPSSYAWT
jgi:hypothetical protein